MNVEAREPPLIALFDSLKIYNQLKFVNISSNKIKDLDKYIVGMQGLIVLNASKNSISDVSFLQKEGFIQLLTIHKGGVLKYLQVINLSNNKI